MVCGMAGQPTPVKALPQDAEPEACATAAADFSVCAHCQSPTTLLIVCVFCRGPRYCSHACQNAAWCGLFQFVTWMSGWLTVLCFYAAAA